MELTLVLMGIIVLLGLIQFFAQGLEAITGFGSTVVAVPIMAMIVPLETAVVIGVTHTWVLVIYIVFISRKDIVWKEFGFIALYVLIGLPFGIYFFERLPEAYLLGLLALFMVGVGFHGFRMTQRNRHRADVSAEPVKKNILMRFILFLGGIVHGAFGTGGPFVVLYATQALKNKALFRVSLCLLWLSMNTILITVWTIDEIWTGEGRWTRNNYFSLYAALATLPFTLVGIVVGNYLHHRVSEYIFRLVVYALLFGTGFIVMYSAASKLLA